ncbi:hypothetical protein L873DRAFT_316120 [Choiromyces venosus 120613-1]|uniref:Uncharacterized protein n=1 Tax=Choiromyces venosus 120613-1 TaxID=1336337 RepID=A0A3N4JC47_9PEZI|nr:hypothetical protein L873DRAFT_316120 [Choiromyces venosus 120613-1]
MCRLFSCKSPCSSFRIRVLKFIVMNEQVFFFFFFCHFISAHREEGKRQRARERAGKLDSSSKICRISRAAFLMAGIYPSTRSIFTLSFALIN